MIWPSVILTTIPLESPTFEQNSFYPNVIMLTQVLPLNLISMFPLKSSSFVFKKALLKAMQISSVLSSSLTLFFVRYSLY
jgi:hypothetical protein